MEDKKKIRVDLFRFDPAVDRVPAYRSYILPYEGETTVLDLLETINEREEPFSFQRECKSFKCGSCTVNVNGFPVLSCKEKIQKWSETDRLVIEPLTCFPLIKDLLVDFSHDLWEREKRRPFPEYADDPRVGEMKIDRSDGELLREYSFCIRCGACMEICPAFKEKGGKFAGPLYLLDISRLFLHPRDQANRLLEAVVEGIEFCTECKKCNEVCPAGLDVFQLAVGKLREGRKIATRQNRGGQ